MAKRRSYPMEFRAQMVELVRAGRKPEELCKEFEPSEQTIRNWVKQAELDGGRRGDGLTTPEKEELQRLRRENKQLRIPAQSVHPFRSNPSTDSGAIRPPVPD